MSSSQGREPENQKTLKRRSITISNGPGRAIKTLRKSSLRSKKKMSGRKGTGARIELTEERRSTGGVIQKAKLLSQGGGSVFSTARRKKANFKNSN